MPKPLLVIVTHFLFLQFSYAQNFMPNIDTLMLSRSQETSEKAKAVVSSFINAMTQNSEKILMNLCAIPFCIEEKQIITTKHELEKTFREMAIQAKGKKYQIETLNVVGVSKEILNGVVPINIYYVFVKLKVFSNDKIIDKGSLFGVQIADDVKIVGFH